MTYEPCAKNELAVIIRRFQKTNKTFTIHMIDESFIYIDDTCEIIYMTDGLNVEGCIKTVRQCAAEADWMYIPYKSIVKVTRFI